MFDWSNLLAIVIYALIGWLLTALVAAVTPRQSYEAVESESASSSDVNRVETKSDTSQVKREEQHEDRQ